MTCEELREIVRLVCELAPALSASGVYVFKCPLFEAHIADGYHGVPRTDESSEDTDTLDPLNDPLTYGMQPSDTPPGFARRQDR